MNFFNQQQFPHQPNIETAITASSAATMSATTAAAMNPLHQIAAQPQSDNGVNVYNRQQAARGVPNNLNFLTQVTVGQNEAIYSALDEYRNNNNSGLNNNGGLTATTSAVNAASTTSAASSSLKFYKLYYPTAALMIDKLNPQQMINNQMSIASHSNPTNLIAGNQTNTNNSGNGRLGTFGRDESDLSTVIDQVASGATGSLSTDNRAGSGQPQSNRLTTASSIRRKCEISQQPSCSSLTVDNTAIALAALRESAAAARPRRGSAAAERRRRQRDAMTEEQRNEERRRNAYAKARRRQMMTEFELEVERFVGAERMRIRRQNMSEEDKEAHRRAAAARMREKRAQMTEEEREAQRRKAADRARSRRKNLTDDELALARLRAAERMRHLRLNMSEEERAAHRSMAAQRTRAYRERSKQLGSEDGDYLSASGLIDFSAGESSLQ